MKLNFFLVEEKEAVTILKVSRPKALNALNSELMKEFSVVLDELSKKESLRALILTGEGDKSFIAGADIAEMSTLTKEQALNFARLGQQLTLKLQNFPAPVIAAVNGYALGGGCEMAISCDFILASKNAVFGQPEVALGLITGFGGAVRLAEFVGWPRASELLYSGRRITADEALAMGLVNAVVEQGALMEKALAVAAQIAGNSPLSVRSLKKAVQKIKNQVTVVDRLETEAQAFSGVFESHDQREGTTAFVEKRKPAFKGC